MKKQELFNVPAILGCVACFVPILFWIAVTLDLVFRNHLMMDYFRLQVDQGVSFIEFLYLVLFPLTIALVNFFFIVRFNWQKQDSELMITMRLDPQPVNLMVLAFASVNVLLICTYSFTENFTLVAR